MRTCILRDDANGQFKIEATDNLLKVSAEGLQFGDEYHTMHELYQHRMALNIMLFKMMFKLDEQVREQKAYTDPLICKSLFHYDGTMFKDYFVVCAYTIQGQISYHYKLKHWDKFDIPAMDKLPRPYDGHSSLDVIDRLMNL